MSDSFDDVLSVIVVNHGIDALKNERMALGLFSDYAPKLRREHSLLKLFYSCEGTSILFLALKSDVAEQELLKNKVVAQMRENWIAEDAAMLVCNSFLKAIRQNGSMRATLSLPEISKAPSKENADERALSSKIRKNDKSLSKERAEDASDVSKVQKHLKTPTRTTDSLKMKDNHINSDVWADIQIGNHYVGSIKEVDWGSLKVDIGGAVGTVKVGYSLRTHFKIGDPIDVYVETFDKRIRTLNLTTVEPPSLKKWENFFNNYRVGDVVSVQIMSINYTGAHVQIVPDINGRIPPSELPGFKIDRTKSILGEFETVLADVTVGQIVDAKIIDISKKNLNVTLSICAIQNR